MRILVTTDNSGLIETLRNTISVHSIKKDAYARRLNEVGVVFTLYDYFQQVSRLLEIVWMTVMSCQMSMKQLY